MKTSTLPLTRLIKLVTGHRRILRAAPMLVVGLFFMGAQDNCDIGGDGCDADLIACEDGHSATDTNGDGCLDSCEPDPQCLAEPVCNAGHTQVDGPSGCLQDDAVCYDVTTCGSTIWCTGEDVGPGCLSDEECGDNERCDTENYCDAAACDEDTNCLAVCLGRCVDNVTCPAIDIQCEDGDSPVDSNGDGCIDSCEPDEIDTCWADSDCDAGQRCDTENYCETECGNGTDCLIACLGRCVDDIVCTDIAIYCEDGTSPVDSDGDGCDDSCEPDEIDTCWDDSDCGDNERCDTEEYCETECGDGNDCLIACLGRCVPNLDCPDVDLYCLHHEIAVDSNGDGCIDSCEPIDECLAIPVCAADEVQVSEEVCETADIACIARSICGVTIFCTAGDDGQSCWDDSDCGENQACNTTDFCALPPECEEGSDCFAVCAGLCVDDGGGTCPPSDILCEEGSEPIDSNGDGCVDSCSPAVDCLAIPTCNAGDEQVEGPSGCLQDDAVCYEVTTCGSTIWCTGEG